MIWKYYCAPQWKMPHRYEHTIHPAGHFGELIGDTFRILLGQATERKDLWTVEAALLKQIWRY